MIREITKDQIPYNVKDSIYNTFDSLVGARYFLINYNCWCVYLHDQKTFFDNEFQIQETKEIEYIVDSYLHIERYREDIENLRLKLANEEAQLLKTKEVLQELFATLTEEQKQNFLSKQKDKVSFVRTYRLCTGCSLFEAVEYYHHHHLF